jgi:hypothetical protein
MASNKKGFHADTNHLFSSYWKHLRKEGKQQFWKKERHLTELSIKKGEDNEKNGPVYESSLSKNTKKRRKKQKQILREHKQILREIDRKVKKTLDASKEIKQWSTPPLRTTGLFTLGSCLRSNLRAYGGSASAMARSFRYARQLRWRTFPRRCYGTLCEMCLTVRHPRQSRGITDSHLRSSRQP